MKTSAYYKTKRVTLNVLIHLFLISVAITCIFPLLWMIGSSLKTQQTIFTDMSLIPAKMHWENYYLAWKEGGFGRYFINSILYTISVVFGIIIVSSLAAYAFSRFKFPGKNAFFYSKTVCVHNVFSVDSIHGPAMERPHGGPGVFTFEKEATLYHEFETCAHFFIKGPLRSIGRVGGGVDPEEKCGGTGVSVVVFWSADQTTNHLKNASKARWRCCQASQNAHILRVCSAFSPPRALPSNPIHIFKMACS